MQIETCIVEIYGIKQRRSETVVKVRRTSGKSAQNRSFEFTYVRALPRDHRPTEVRHLRDLASRVAHHADQWQIRRAPGSVSQPNVQGCWNGVIANVWRVMAG